MPITKKDNIAMQISAMMLTAALTMFGTQNMSQAGEDTPNVLRNCTVEAKHNSYVPADLPAQQGGTLLTIAVKVGDQVKKGDVLATVDNKLEMLQLDASKQRLAMAQEEAENDVNIRYSIIAHKVAEQEYLAVIEAVRSTRDAFTTTQVLKYSLSVDQLKLQREQAEHEQNLARMSVRVREAEYKLAEHELARRLIKAPVDGVVDDVDRVEGDWVRAGEPIVRLVKMDQLRIKGSLEYDPLTPADVRGKPVTVTVELARGKVHSFKGRVDSTGSLFGRGEFEIEVEVENEKDPNTGDWLLMPGMTATVEIHL
jgi:multidrug resistance efflux pump